jgi:hypothetical protein
MPGTAAGRENPGAADALARGRVLQIEAAAEAAAGAGEKSFQNQERTF